MASQIFTRRLRKLARVHLRTYASARLRASLRARTDPVCAGRRRRRRFNFRKCLLLLVKPPRRLHLGFRTRKTELARAPGSYVLATVCDVFMQSRRSHQCFDIYARVRVVVVVVVGVIVIVVIVTDAAASVVVMCVCVCVCEQAGTRIHMVVIGRPRNLACRFARDAHTHIMSYLCLCL